MTTTNPRGYRGLRRIVRAALSGVLRGVDAIRSMMGRTPAGRASTEPRRGRKSQAASGLKGAERFADQAETGAGGAWSGTSSRRLVLPDDAHPLSDAEMKMLAKAFWGEAAAKEQSGGARPAEPDS